METPLLSPLWDICIFGRNIFSLPLSLCHTCQLSRGDQNQKCFKSLTALLLISSFPGNYEEDDDGSQGRLEWKSGQGQAFAQGGFRLEGNKIVIPHTGLYFVYSQSSFRVSCGDGDEEGAGQSHVPLSHRVWRYTNSLGKEASLMNAVRSACQNAPQEDGFRDGQGWYNAIYLGAVFKLNKGDRLRTETNQLSELETDDGKTFFGVFAL